jgi:hypothetical protein
MAAIGSDRISGGAFRTWALALVMALVACRSIAFLGLLGLQPPGVDFSPSWAAARLALSDPSAIYDFQRITQLQGWPLGPTLLRPFIYPPSALPLFAPLAGFPHDIAYGVWMVATAAVLALAARQARAPLWLFLFPASALVALCGQVTFLIAGLTLAGLAMKDRPILAGVLLGVAAAVKPQLMMFAPLGLVADGRWRTLFAAGAAGAALCVLSVAVWGVELWRDWLAALPRFQNDVILTNPSLMQHGITPFTTLRNWHLPAGWPLLLAPFAAWMVWAVFRKTEDLAARHLVVSAAPLLVLTYAMNYEAALFAPGIAMYMSRTRDTAWIGYMAIGVGYAIGFLYGCLPVALALSLPLISTLAAERVRRAV